MISQLDRQRFTPVAAIPHHGPLQAMLRRIDVPVATVPSLRLSRTRNPLSLARQGLDLLAFRRRLGALVGESGASILHANSIAAGLAATTLPRGMPPVVCHVRDLSFPRAAVDWIVSGSAAVIAISECVREAVLQAAPDAGERVRVIHNGIDPARFQPGKTRAEVRSMLGLAAGERLVGMVSQLVPWKQHERFLQTAAAVSERVKAVRFIIVGADLFGEHRDYVDSLYEQAAQLGLRERIIWAGYRDDVADLMHAMDVLVHPAEQEPLGRVVLEAMCVGTPCVAVDQCGPAELISSLESGMLTPPEPGAMAEAVVTLLTKAPLARAISAAAQEAVRTRFSALRAAQLTQKVYEDVLLRPPARRWLI
jgi:glycosyltransferase involved in cell wall biosynthesis